MTPPDQPSSDHAVPAITRGCTTSRSVVMAGNSTESGRSVTSKITSILLTFTEGSEHSLTEIARLAGLPISTAHRLDHRTGLLAAPRAHRGRAVPGRSAAADDRHHGRLPAEHRRACALRVGGPVRSHQMPGPARGTARSPGRLHPERARSAAGDGVLRRCHPAAARHSLGRVLLAFAPSRTVEMTIIRGLRPYTAHTVDLARPTAPGIGGDPADPGGGHPLGARGRDVRCGDAGVRSGR